MLHIPLQSSPKAPVHSRGWGRGLQGCLLPLVSELITRLLRSVAMVVSAWNPQGSPVQDRFWGWSLGSHTRFPYYISHKHLGHVALSRGLELGFDSQLTLFPPMIQGKEPKSVPFLEWGGDFLVSLHENLFGSQLCPEKPVLAPSDSWSKTTVIPTSVVKPYPLSRTSALYVTTDHVASALFPHMAFSLSLVLGASLSFGFKQIF